MSEGTPDADVPDVSVDDIRCCCPVDGVLELVSGKYAIQVICLVGAVQPARYAEIEEALEDVSSSTLSNRLEELTEAGLLHRESYDEIPPRVEYRMTGDGEELCRLLQPLVEWANEREGSAL